LDPGWPVRTGGTGTPIEWGRITRREGRGGARGCLPNLTQATWPIAGLSLPRGTRWGRVPVSFPCTRFDLPARSTAPQEYYAPPLFVSRGVSDGGPPRGTSPTVWGELRPTRRLRFDTGVSALLLPVLAFDGFIGRLQCRAIRDWRWRARCEVTGWDLDSRWCARGFFEFCLWTFLTLLAVCAAPALLNLLFPV